MTMGLQTISSRTRFWSMDVVLLVVRMLPWSKWQNAKRTGLRAAAVLGIALGAACSPSSDTSSGGGMMALPTPDIAFVLTWDSFPGPNPDVGIWVVEPSFDLLDSSDQAGQPGWVGLGPSSTGGTVDFNDEGACGASIPDPFLGREVVSWPFGDSPSGCFQYGLHYVVGCPSIVPIDYTLTVLVNGATVDTRSGTLSQITGFWGGWGVCNN